MAEATYTYHIRKYVGCLDPIRRQLHFVGMILQLPDSKGGGNVAFNLLQGVSFSK